MAVTATLKASGVVDEDTSGTNSASEVLGAITFAADSLIAVFLGATPAGSQSLTAGWLTCTASGHTFTTQASAYGVDGNESRASAEVLTAPTSGGSVAITVSSGVADVFGLFYAIYELTGYDTGDPTDAVAGLTGGSITGVEDGAFSITLNAAPVSESLVLGFLHIDLEAGTSAITHGTGWTEDVEIDSSASNFGAAQAQRRTGSTSTTVTWDDIKGAGSPAVWSMCGVAVEIVAGGGAAVSGTADGAFGELTATITVLEPADLLVPLVRSGLRLA